MAERQLIIAVEGTAALGPYWQTILSDYLDKIIRCFHGSEVTGQKLSGPNPELALVVFNTHGAYSAFLVQRSGWTKDVDVFSQWLSGIPFNGGGFGEAAIAEGLAEALMMFSSAKNVNQSHQSPDVQKHCILVAASNPHALPTPVYCPPVTSIEHGENVETEAEICLADAETVAKSFGQCFASLSVISPKQLPKLRAIYTAGKRNPRASDSAVDNLKHPQFLILLSECFMEARAASSRPLIGNLSSQNVVKLDGTSAPIPAPPTSAPSANGAVINRQPVPVGNVPSATVKVEPTTVSTMVSGPGFSHLPSISNVSSQGVPSLQTSSPSPTSQEMNALSEPMQDFKPLINPSSQTRPVGPANMNILNSISTQHRHMMNSASIAGANSIGLPTIGTTPMAMHMSNMISNGMTSTAISGIASGAGSGPLMASAQIGQNTTLGSFASAASAISGNSSVGLSPALANLQGNTGIGQSVPTVGQGTVASGTQIGQGGISMNQNILSGLGPNSISSGPGTMIPTPGMQQQGPVHSLGMTTNSSITMPLTQNPSGVQQAQSKYVKIWEGNLSGQRQGQPVFICKLEGYRSISSPEMLAADWPNAMQIVRLISQDHMNNKQYVGKADFLVFRTLNQHGFLAQLQEKKLDMVVFKPQVSSQHQQQQQQQQQQLQQQQLQQQQLQQQQLQQQPQQHLQHQQLQQQTQPQQQQQIVGSGMCQTFVQGAVRPQMMPQGKVPPQGPGNMTGGGFLP